MVEKKETTPASEPSVDQEANTTGGAYQNYLVNLDGVNVAVKARTQKEAVSKAEKQIKDDEGAK